MWGKLLTLNNSTAFLYANARCPVRNTSYRDVQSIGGFATNTKETANYFFDDATFRLVNLAEVGSFNASGAAYMDTGLVGRVDRDTMLKRIHLVSDAYSAIATTPTVTVLSYQPGRNTNGSQQATVLTTGGYWDIPGNPRGRTFEAQATFPSTAGQISVSRLVFELQDSQVDKGTWLVGQ